MKTQYFQAYNLNMEYEFNTYKNVGKDYGNRKNANLGMLLNWKRFKRKCIENKEEKVYKFCNTYTEWKTHVKEILPVEFNNYDDMLHWLYMKKRDAESFLEAIKAILIPVYIALLGVMEFVEPFNSDKYAIGSIEEKLCNMGNFFFFLFILIVIVWVSTKALGEAERKVDFYTDFICIAEEKVYKGQYLVDISRHQSYTPTHLSAKTSLKQNCVGGLNMDDYKN